MNLKPSPFQSIAIIGLGMMGGSFAKLIREVYPESRILGVARRSESAQYAVEHHIVDEAFLSCDELPQGINLVLICTAISSVNDIYRRIANHLISPATITDIASVKEGLKLDVSTLPDRHSYILGHPMAGIEQIGIEAANASILKNARYFLISDNSPSFSRLELFLKTLSFFPVPIALGQHDSTVAAGSHIPYLMAALTTNNALNQNQQHDVTSAIGPGFRDSTRVAKSAPEWGVDICTYNKDALLTQLSSIQTQIEILRQLIESGNSHEIQNWLTKSRDFLIHLPQAPFL